jgi:hypothetical protein
MKKIKNTSFSQILESEVIQSFLNVRYKSQSEAEIIKRINMILKARKDAN